jgi:hypothetical protein
MNNKVEIIKKLFYKTNIDKYKNKYMYKNGSFANDPYDVSILFICRGELASLALKGRFPHGVGKMSAKPTKGDGSVRGGPR